MEKQPLTSEQFGESQYGQRLQYSKPQYRDVAFAIAYYIHVLIVLGMGGYLWISQYPQISDNDSSDWQTDLSLNGIFVGIACCLVCGILFGLLWLEMMKRFASRIIKAMLFLNIGCWCAVALVGVVSQQIVVIIIGVLFALIYALWTWYVTKSI